MDKVMNIARSLNGGGSGPAPEAKPQGQGQGDLAGLLGGLAQSGGNGGGAPSIDPETLGKIMRLWNAYNSGSDPQKTAVLHAMKPYLRSERQERVDRALQTLRLVHVAREALGVDLLGSLFSGGGK